MNEANRKQRNTDRIAELWPSFGQKIRAVIEALEAEGLRPRIQDAWRSPQDQLKAFNTGHSQLKFGFHNVTGANGKKESLAVDVLDDNKPLNIGTEFLLHLAAAAEAQGLTTGIRWKVPANLVKGIDDAIANEDWEAPVKVGWDPTHVQPNGITPSEAKAGKRPA
ncbi:MAG TPA: hypothetical protein VFI24_05260 [Pyrinomonadaceae bacterium]|nr:hypothetical protein [Pyrinomonadaceae bacterium]